LQQGFIEASYRITDHAATQIRFTPTQLNALGLAKQSRLKCIGASWNNGMSILSYGGTFVSVYLIKPSVAQNHIQLINDYLFSANDPSWDGDIEIWPDDVLEVYVTDNQGTADFTVRLRGEYVFA
jgi:hypothetical protein